MSLFVVTMLLTNESPTLKSSFIFLLNGLMGQLVCEMISRVFKKRKNPNLYHQN